MKYSQRHDGTDLTDPRNLVHFIKNQLQNKSAYGNHEIERPKAETFYFFFIFQVVNLT